jgi:hypothetical protein
MFLTFNIFLASNSPSIADLAASTRLFADSTAILANSILADAEKVCNDAVATFVLAIDIKADAEKSLRSPFELLSDEVYAFKALIEFIVDELNVFILVTDVFKLAVVELILVIDTLVDAVNELIEAVNALNDAEGVNVWSANIVIEAISPSTFGTILAEAYPLKKNLVDVPILAPLTIIWFIDEVKFCNEEVA